MGDSLEKQFISLLYPNEQSKIFHQDIANRPNISADVTRELGLDEIFSVRGISLGDFFTMDEEVIRYRLSTVCDCLDIPELVGALGKVRPVLDDIRQLRLLEEEQSSSDAYLYSITEIELYVSAIEVLYEGLAPLKERLKSSAFVSLLSLLEMLTQSQYYKELNERLASLSARVHEIHSITVGVNLDATMRPVSAGVISINSETFKSGKLLDKILRFSFRNDAFTTIAPLSPVSKGTQSDNRQEALIASLNNAIEEVYRSSVKGWRAIVDEYVLDNADFLLQLTPEIEFLSRGVEVLLRLRDEKGEKITFPEIASRKEKAFVTKGIYNPRVALAISEPVVTNDLVFDAHAGIYILTGPNRGGKSVITVAMGAVQAMFQLGLPVPCEYAKLSVADGIFTHFPEGADDTIDKGRLGEECARLREIFDCLSEDSIVLLDESFSSTGAFEATYIASEILVALCARRVRGIFSTHLHDLASTIDELNRRSATYGGVALDTLVAGIEEGRRSFLILRAKPDGKSYARDIAQKYGLSLEELLREGGETL